MQEIGRENAVKLDEAQQAARDCFARDDIQVRLRLLIYERGMSASIHVRYMLVCEQYGQQLTAIAVAASQGAKAALARMRFYRNIEQAVRYWQPGKPFMHH